MTDGGRKRQAIGKRGEYVAGQYLESLGYCLLGHNYHTRYGELDLIAQDGETIVFVEVKTRRGEAFGTPEEAITQRKRAHLCRAALAYLQERNLMDSACRFDVIGIVIGGSAPRVAHTRDAFRCDDVP